MRTHPTVVENISFNIDEERLLREMRVSKIKSLSQLEEAPLAASIKRAMDIGYTLIHGKGVYVTLDLGDLRWAEELFTGADMARLLAECPKATIMAVTIGGALETEVERLDRTGDITGAYLLEMVGGLMADYMADRLDERIEREIKKAGFGRTMRFSPGYGDWPLDRQPVLLKALAAEKIGVTLTESHIMIPRKSVSAVIGWKGKA